MMLRTKFVTSTAGAEPLPPLEEPSSAAAAATDAARRAEEGGGGRRAERRRWAVWDQPARDPPTRSINAASTHRDRSVYMPGQEEPGEKEARKTSVCGEVA